MQVTASTTFSDLLQEVQRFWTPLPDKPEETPEGLLAALWNTACGTPLSVDRATSAPLPALDDAAQARLRGIIQRRQRRARGTIHGERSAAGRVPKRREQSLRRLFGLVRQRGPEALYLLQEV